MQEQERYIPVHIEEEPESEAPAPPPTVPQRLARIERGLQTLLRGQADLTVAFGRIYKRVEELERDAQWKVWAVRLARVALPAIGGAAVAKWPQLASVVSELLKASAQP
jgi:hypothetical protein